MKLPKTKQEAIALGLNKYDAGAPCASGHVSPSYVSTSSCIECHRLKVISARNKRREADPEAYRTKEREEKRAAADRKAEAKQPAVEAEQIRVLGLMFSMGINLPTERAEAKELGESQYFNGKPCPFGHIAARQTSSGTCAECLAPRRRAHMAKFRAEKPEEAKTRAEAERKKFAERYRLRAKQYNKVHKVRLNAIAKEYAKNNPEVKRTSNEKRKRLQMQATPSWLTDRLIIEIQNLYKAARVETKHTGIKHSVDHIVQIGAKNVCGLHVPWNIRVVTAEENLTRTKDFREPHLAFAPILGETTLLGSFTL